MSSQITDSDLCVAPPTPDAPAAAPANRRPALEFKGLSHPALRVIVNDAATHSLERTLAALSQADNHGFEWQPVIIDASRLSPQEAPDWPALVNGLRALRLHPIALAGAQEAARETAHTLQLGWLANLPEPKRRASHAPPPTEAPPAQSSSPESPSKPAADTARALDPLIIDRPVRSGQQVYARDRDLIVVGGVSPGAEVIADGHVHIYGPLGGRAIAGARGRRDASIFALALHAELVAVSGIYRTFDDGLPPDLLGKPVRIALDMNADSLVLKGL